MQSWPAAIANGTTYTGSIVTFRIHPAAAVGSFPINTFSMSYDSDTGRTNTSNSLNLDGRWFRSRQRPGLRRQGWRCLEQCAVSGGGVDIAVVPAEVPAHPEAPQNIVPARRLFEHRWRGGVSRESERRNWFFY